MISPEMQVKIAGWRQKCRDGTATMGEMQEAMRWLREDRTAATASAKKTPGSRAASKAPINSDNLLAELGGL
jgi:hypothetical protein